MVRILFVCTGNTCRSPMAAALLQDRLHRWGIADKVAVSSAGIAAWTGQAASAAAILLAPAALPAQPATPPSVTVTSFTEVRSPPSTRRLPMECMPRWVST